MILTEDQVKEYAKQKKADKWIEKARETTTLLRMHYYGTGLTEYLTQIQSLENETQVKLRRKYAISNQALLDSLFRPVDNAWSAKGGLISIDASETVQKDLKEDIEQSLKGGSLKDYLRNFWFDRFVTDPNGLIFMEVNDDGETFPTYKSIYDIRKMEVNGITPEYIVFEPHEIEEEESTLGKPITNDIKWIVDDAFYYKVKLKGESAIIIDQIPNSFGEVPAVQNSLIFDTETGIKISPIHKQSDLLSSYLIDNSINNIYKKLHGFPVFWFYTGKCDSCKGTGTVSGETCNSCNGSGQSMKRDVSDGIPLKTPKNADAPTIAPNVAGYIQPALETWQEQRTELDHLFNLIYYSMWGSTVERSDNETATGRFIDAQPVMNKLEHFTDMFEVIHKKVLELYTKFYYTNSDIGVSVSYGRRYLIETPDQLWKKYLETLEKGADDSTKDLQLSQYYETEFQSDEVMRDYHLKLMTTEPLVHYSVTQVLDMPVSQMVKDMKVSFTAWKNRTLISFVVESTQEQLDKNLREFTIKLNDDGKGEPEQSEEVQEDSI